MLQVVGAIIFIAIAYTTLLLAAQHMPPAWQTACRFSCR
jgi:hypothetical protein